MATSEAQKRAVAKWQAEHMTVMTVKMKTEIREAFRAACEQNGVTPHGVLLSCIKQYIEQNEQHKPT